MVSLWRRLWRNEEGSVFVIGALGAMALVGAVGIAVDSGRAQMAQTKLQNAVDAAGLAAGASVNSADLTTVVNKYLVVNFSQGTLGTVITNVNPVLSEDGQILTITATATQPTTFMRIFKKNEVTLSATTEVTRTNKGMELALVLDTTGSMAGSKLTALKTASHNLLDILFGNETTATNLWVGVVPFSQAVNIGNSHTSWLDAAHYTSLNWGPTSWAGCVEARWANGNDVTDATPFPGTLPGSEKFKAYYWPDDNNNNWITNGTSSNTVNTSLCSKKSSCTCSNYGPCTTTTNGNVSTTISCSGSGNNRSCNKAVTTTTPTTNYTIDNEHGPNRYCPSTLTRLTNVKADVETGIDALTARGNTHVSEGAAWGYRLLSPNWQGLWGGTMQTNSLPLAYNTPLMVKAVVLMTDGENTISDNVDGAYDYLSQNRLGTTNGTTAITKLNTKLSTVCTALKSKGIIVYTILFDLNNASVGTLMKNCASSPDYYFESPDAATLQQAFKTIGDSLANLRISR